MCSDDNHAICYPTIIQHFRCMNMYVCACVCSRMELTQSRVVVTVLPIWPAMLLVAVVTGHCLQLDLLGQGRQIWKKDRYREEERKKKKGRKKEGKKERR